MHVTRVQDGIKSLVRLNSRMLTRSNHSLVQLQIPSASERKQRTSSNYNTTAHNDAATQQLVKAGVGVDTPLQAQVAVHSAISRVTSLQVSARVCCVMSVDTKAPPMATMKTCRLHGVLEDGLLSEEMLLVYVLVNE